MTYKENITAILECYFAGFKKEIIDSACNRILEQEPTIQERQAESDKFDAAFQDGYNNGYAQARFDYEQEPKTGHWRHYEGMLICSECGAEFYDDIMEYCGDDVPKVCLDCGAKMESEEME